MLVPRASSLMAELEVAGGSDGRGAGDPTRQIAALTRLVQAASACPADVQVTFALCALSFFSFRFFFF